MCDEGHSNVWAKIRGAGEGESAAGRPSDSSATVRLERSVLSEGGSVNALLSEMLCAGECSAVVEIEEPSDIVLVRSFGRDLCKSLGTSACFQTRVATLISELARNIVQYAGSGCIEISVPRDGRPRVEVVARDRGPGIADLDEALERTNSVAESTGSGLRGTRNLADQFEVTTRVGAGTVVTVRKFLPT